MVRNGGALLEKLRNLKECICSPENLLAAYREAAKGKHYRNEVMAFTFNLDERLSTLRDELLNGTYAVGRYREFYVRYPKPRLVMALGFRDRIVQWAIYRQLNPFIDKRFIAHSYGCRKDKGTLAAAECLKNWMQKISRKPDVSEWVLIKGDISKYFYRISHERIMRMYAQLTDDEWFLGLMGAVINNPDIPFGLPPGTRADDCPREKRLYDVGMPIGNLSSQETANVYLDRLDQYCKHVLKLRYYVRYMDDFCILVKGRADAVRILGLISEFLSAELLLDISPKTRILPAWRDVEFVGYIISPHGMRLRKKTVKHIKRSLRHMSALYTSGKLDIESILQSINSYHGMAQHCNAYNLLMWIEKNVALTRGEPYEDWNGVYEQITA